MFLVILCDFLHILKYIFGFIENHSVLVGLITAVVTGSLWLKKFIRQKRAEAFFGFYAKLSLRLRCLEEKLNEKNQLNITNEKAGNIYCLIYLEDYTKTVCPSYKTPSDKELEAYKLAANELKEILLTTNHNVYPPKAKQKEWYESQYIVFSFCDFLINNEYHHVTNQAFQQNTGKYKHIEKCEELVKAIQYIKEAIDKSKY